MLDGMRHRQARGPGLSAFGLMSVIALLALACFPALAQAEDSSGVQYSDDIPRLPGDNNSQTGKKQAIANSSTDDGGASAPTGKSGSAGSRGGSSEDESSAKGAPGSGNDGGTGQGSPGGSANGAGENGVQAGAQTNATSASEQSDDGSSPLVPILLAILVLAALSLAAVLIRQRRKGGSLTTSVSQKAN